MDSRYAQTFLGTDAGRQVLGDLRKRFGIGRLCYESNSIGRFDHTAAAIIDGERRVLLHIELALTRGAPGKGLPQLLTEAQPNENA